jgi:zinc/manganese transport system ATP-binding protein
VTAVLRLCDLTLGYRRHPAVHHLTGAVEAGALLAVVGPNGAGKSTLLKGIVGLMAPLSGTINRTVDVHDIAYLPQIAEIDRSFPINVYDLVAMGLWRRIGPFGAIRETERERIHDAIATVGLSGFERRPIAALSGGQMQRVLFARLSLQDSILIVLDEPFNAIDDRTVADLVALVQRWHAEGRTVLAALHEMNLVSRHFPQTLLIAREPVAWGETGSVLTAENLVRAQHMCEAFEEGAAECAIAAP